MVKFKMKILGLFFTRGMSVEGWEKAGLLDREKRVYEELLLNKTFKKNLLVYLWDKR